MRWLRRILAEIVFRVETGLLLTAGPKPNGGRR